MAFKFKNIFILNNKINFKKINYDQIKMCNFKYDNFKYPVKKIEICTLKNFYNKPNYNLKNGLNFKIDYCDTGSMLNNPNDAPVVLAIHGAPGNHQDFKLYIKFLTLEMGARVIVPNFQDFNATDLYKVYLHSVQEKAIYLNDFLKAINLDSVDMLITHSSGIYLSLYLWNDLPDNYLQNIRSFVFFSPPGYKRVKAMKPKWFVDTMASVYSDTLGRKILRKIGSSLLKLANTSVKIDNLDNVFIACVTMKNSQIQNLYQNLIKLRNYNKPVLLVFGERDKLIESKFFFDQCNLFKIDNQNVIMLEKNGQVLNKFSQNSLHRAIMIKDAGHYCLNSHSDVLKNYLKETLSLALKEKESKCQIYKENYDESSIQFKEKAIKI